MFFHSFPRPRGNGPVDEDKGLKILESVLKSGLLLVPEVTVYPPETPEGQEYRLIQSRFCLTQLDTIEDLERHAEFFGTFHLEFSDSTMYALGVLPVMYLPKRSRHFPETPTPLADLAGFFIHRLLELQELCRRMKQLDCLLVENRNSKTIEITDEKDNASIINTKQARAVLDMLRRDMADYDQIQGALQGFASLFYPTDMDYWNKEEKRDYCEQLYYFRQREWRIIRGISIAGKTVDEQLSDDEKKFLLEIDRNFYGPGEKEIVFADRERRPKVCECTVIRRIDGKPAGEKIEYIIVPTGKVKDAKELAKNHGFNPDKIVDMKTRGGKHVLQGPKDLSRVEKHVSQGAKDLSRAGNDLLQVGNDLSWDGTDLSQDGNDRLRAGNDLLWDGKYLVQDGKGLYCRNDCTPVWG
jgi:hypothetical protein